MPPAQTTPVALSPALLWLLSLACLLGSAPVALAAEPCRVQIVDAQNGWPVPLIELRTTHNLRFVTDNAGVISLDAPELMGRETFFHLIGHGYTVPTDGFGYAGVRITPQAGKTIRIRVSRENIAKRLGRLTGTGLFAESQKCGDYPDWTDAPLTGQDSVLMTRYRDKLFWIWGDTSVYRYPLGVFHSTAATTPLHPVQSFQPPLKPDLDYFVDRQGHPRAVAQMPGNGPTWITGLIALPDQDGNEHLLATYSKISGHLHAYERGLCEWSDDTQSFQHTQTLWRENDDQYTQTLWHDYHPFLYTDKEGNQRVGMGNPLPKTSFPATYEAWQNPDTWRSHQPQRSLRDAEGNEVALHTGSIAYNPYRNKWVTIFMQRGGSPSAFGEIWYAEADDPFGPWGPAVKVLTHDNYTFYNPRIHFELTDADDNFIIFEGTYTAEFANHAEPTPRYNYNQIWYRLDLDDPQLKSAQNK